MKLSNGKKAERIIACIRSKHRLVPELLFTLKQLRAMELAILLHKKEDDILEEAKSIRLLLESSIDSLMDRIENDVP